MVCKFDENEIKTLVNADQFQLQLILMKRHVVQKQSAYIVTRNFRF